MCLSELFLWPVAQVGFFFKKGDFAAFQKVRTLASLNQDMMNIWITHQPVIYFLSCAYYKTIVIVLCCWLQSVPGRPLPDRSWAVSQRLGWIPGLPGAVSGSELGQRPLLLQGWRTHGHLQRHDTKGRSRRTAPGPQGLGWGGDSHFVAPALTELRPPLCFVDDPQWHPALPLCLRGLPLWIFSRCG